MLHFILGGARSGKSDFAERLALRSGRPVLYVATMEPGDDEMRSRIDAHRAARPLSWRTVEAPHGVVEAVEENANPGDFVIVDCITLWVSNLLIAEIADAEVAGTADVARGLDVTDRCVGTLAGWAYAFDGHVALVSNEVGLGLVPPYPLGRIFRDALGSANRRIASRADRVYHLTAGLVLELRSLGASPLEAYGGESP